MLDWMCLASALAPEMLLSTSGGWRQGYAGAALWQKQGTPATWTSSPWWRIPKALSFLPPLPRIGCDVGFADSTACVTARGAQRKNAGGDLERAYLVAVEDCKLARVTERKDIISKMVLLSELHAKFICNLSANSTLSGVILSLYIFTFRWPEKCSLPDFASRAPVLGFVIRERGRPRVCCCKLKEATYYDGHSFAP